MKRVFLSAILLIAWAGFSYSSQESAQQIVNEMLTAYEKYWSYMDEGEVRTVFHEANGRTRTVVKPFSTAFVRPSDYRFEFKNRRGEEEWDSYIVWSGANTVKTWWSLRPGIEAKPDLSHAIAGATGVSGGSAVMIPALLVPQHTPTVLRHNWLKLLSNPVLKGVEEVNGLPAYKIEGKDAGQEALTFWVDQTTRLIVRFYERNTFPTFDTEKTITYKPQANVPIDPSRLALNVPGN